MGDGIYKTSNVCARGIQFDVVNGIIHNVVFNGGCKGNTQGVAKAVEQYITENQ